MRVAVLGAGVTGVTTAYYLARDGHDVVVIDRAPSAAAESSFANGAQLSYSYTDPLAQPALLPKLPAVLLARDPAIRMRIAGNAGILSWGRAFLGQCTRARARSNMLAILKLALESQRRLADIMQEVPLEFSWRRAGKLVLLAGEAEAEAARTRSALKRAAGCDVRVIAPDEAIDLEPALARMDRSFAAAVYAPGDEVGDAQRFSAGLCEWLARERGVEFRFSETIAGLAEERGRLTGVRTGDETITVDAAVVCLGPWSGDLLAPLKIPLPICPVRGYSVTLPASEAAPSISITSVAHRIVWSRLGDTVRVAGFADFVARDTAGDRRRVEQLLEISKTVAPGLCDYEAGDFHAWGGFRPVTPDSRPLVGGTRMPGLFLNTGHGVLGWTLACATAADIARRVGPHNGAARD